VIFDQFKAQTTEGFLATLESNSISFVKVPAHCTDHLQPLDLRDHLKASFQEWYACVKQRVLAGNDKKSYQSSFVIAKTTRVSVTEESM